MIDVCEFVVPDGAIRHSFPPSWPDDVLTAIDIARNTMKFTRHPCWIEKRGQPASRPTIEKDLRWMMRTMSLRADGTGE